MVAIVGLGFVGGAMFKSFTAKGINVYGYDKYKNNGNTLIGCLDHDIIFLALPTLFCKETNTYDKSAIYEVVKFLKEHEYSGSIVLKSTVEPGTCKSLGIIHNPEFLTARTAFEDFHNQKHIVIGGEKIDKVVKFYESYYSDAIITKCSSTESECVKIFCNSFYSVKVQFFTELYSLCNKIDCDYDIIKNIMIKNNWINPMHTQIPGPDGQISYGGACFPKDTNALCSFMKLNDSIHSVLESTIKERNILRDD